MRRGGWENRSGHGQGKAPVVMGRGRRRGVIPACPPLLRKFVSGRIAPKKGTDFTVGKEGGIRGKSQHKSLERPVSTTPATDWRTPENRETRDTVSVIGKGGRRHMDPRPLLLRSGTGHPLPAVKYSTTGDPTSKGVNRRVVKPRKESPSLTLGKLGRGSTVSR